jgi:hypothetical protein
MADPVRFDVDLGQPGYSAKVNRLIRQDIRMARFLGNVISTKLVTTGTSYIYLFRYPYRVKRNPFDRVLQVLEYAASGTVTTTIVEYTIDDGVTWTPIGITAGLADWTTGSSSTNGSFEVDLSGIAADTWIGARIQFVANGFANINVYCSSAILYRAAYPPF